MPFPKIKKRFALTNSYFKNAYSNMPQNPQEILEYVKEHGELPYNAEVTDNWMYDCFIEFQKRNRIYLSQFFTPPKTAARMAELSKAYFDEGTILDACCGFGMLTKALQKLGRLDVHGFDFADNVGVFYKEVNVYFQRLDFRDYLVAPASIGNIISNPPYETKDLIEFLECLEKWLKVGGTAILLIPKGFVDKDKPKNLVAVLDKFEVTHRENMQEPFAHTKVGAEIVVVTKK